MKQLFTIIILFITSQFVIAQNSVYPDLPYTGLYYIVAEGTSIVAVGSCDKAMYSHDSGETWTYMDVTVDVYGIALLPGTNGREILMYNRNDMYRLNTSDESITTIGVTPSSLISGRFEGLHIMEDRVVLVGSVSIFQATVADLEFTKVGDLDYGSSDQIRYTDLTTSNIWVGTKEGLVFKGDLLTNTMSLVYDFEKDMRNLAIGSDDVGYASLSGESSLYKTLDGGSTWTPMTSFSEISTLYAHGDNIVISRNTNRIVVSTDGGLSSEYISYSDDSDHSYLAGLYITENGDTYMAGESSTILKSSDYGITFENLNAYPRESFNYIDMNDNGIGIAVGDKSQIITTDDGGESWTAFTYETTSSNNYFSGCVVKNDGSRLVFNNEGVFEFNDNSISMISDESLSNVMYISSDDSFVGVKYQGGSHIVKRSIDGGVTWESKAVLTSYGYYQSQNENGTVIISMDDNEFAISRDFGETWEIKDNPLNNSLFGISMYGDDLGLVASGYSLYKTTDGFETFEEVSYGYAQNNVQIYSEDHYIFTSGQNSVTTVKESKDGGDTWSVVDEYCSLSFDAILVGDKYWMSQRGGHINFTKLDLTSSVNENIVVSSLNIKNNILQNGDDLILEFDRPITGEGEMLDQNGRTVHQFDIRNSRTASITGNDLSAGIYFLRIAGEGEIHQGKIVVVN